MSYNQFVFFLTKLLTLGILFWTAVRVVVVAKLVILGILFLTSCILALRAVVVATSVVLGISFLTSFVLALIFVLVAKLVISGILSSIFLILTSFLLHHLIYLNQQDQVLIFQHLYLLYFSNSLN